MTPVKQKKILAKPAFYAGAGRPVSFFPRKKSAFTLVEILIALAMCSILLMALATLSFQIMSIWAADAEDPLFDRHVDGLRRALEECVAETADSANGTGTTSGTAARTTTTRARALNTIFTTPPGSVGMSTAPYLRITGAPEFLVPETLPLGNVRGWLVLEQDGLILYWQTDDERRVAADATHRLVLSPWAVDMYFLAYAANEDAWTLEDDPANIQSGSSVFLQLTLVHRGQTRNIFLPLADSAPHNLNY